MWHDWERQARAYPRPGSSSISSNLWEGGWVDEPNAWFDTTRLEGSNSKIPGSKVVINEQTNKVIVDTEARRLDSNRLHICTNPFTNALNVIKC